MWTVYIHSQSHTYSGHFFHRINKLRTSLQTNLNKHISIIQTLQRDIRQKTEFRLEALRDSNVQIMRSFKYVIDILCISNYMLCFTVNLYITFKYIINHWCIFTRLFSEGGNFTPQEIEVFHSHLEKMDKRIDSAEWAVIQDMEERETKCLEQVEIKEFSLKNHTLKNY